MRLWHPNEVRGGRVSAKGMEGQDGARLLRVSAQRVGTRTHTHTRQPATHGWVHARTHARFSPNVQHTQPMRNAHGTRWEGPHTVAGGGGLCAQGTVRGPMTAAQTTHKQLIDSLGNRWDLSPKDVTRANRVRPICPVEYVDRRCVAGPYAT